MPRLRRSVLYVPCNNQKALHKACSLNADVLIYDFEDAVLADQKPMARLNLSSQLAKAKHQSEVIIRLNNIHSGAFYDDIAWLESNQDIDGVLLPKVKDVGELQLAKKQLTAINLHKPIWLLVETIQAVLNLSELTSHLDKGGALVLGAEDLTRQMKITATPGRLGLLPIFTQLILHGRVAGLSIIDAIFSNLEDDLGLRQSSEQARNLGFDGKSLIHPKQIATVNGIFSPSPEDIEKAQKIVAAWEEKPEHLGVVTVDSQVIEQLHVEQAKELLQIAQQ